MLFWIKSILRLKFEVSAQQKSFKEKIFLFFAEILLFTFHQLRYRS